MWKVLSSCFETWIDEEKAVAEPSLFQALFSNCKARWLTFPNPHVLHSISYIQFRTEAKSTITHLWSITQRSQALMSGFCLLWSLGKYLQDEMSWFIRGLALWVNAYFYLHLCVFHFVVCEHGGLTSFFMLSLLYTAVCSSPNGFHIVNL